jgi:hypothetical protein
MLWLWWLGSLCLLPYCATQAQVLLPVYIANVIFVSIMIRYKYFPRRGSIVDEQPPDWYVEPVEED